MPIGSNTSYCNHPEKGENPEWCPHFSLSSAAANRPPNQKTFFWCAMTNASATEDEKYYLWSCEHCGVDYTSERDCFLHECSCPNNPSKVQLGTVKKFLDVGAFYVADADLSHVTNRMFRIRDEEGRMLLICPYHLDFEEWKVGRLPSGLRCHIPVPESERKALHGKLSFSVGDKVVVSFPKGVFMHQPWYQNRIMTIVKEGTKETLLVQLKTESAREPIEVNRIYVWPLERWHKLPLIKAVNPSHQLGSRSYENKH